MSDCTHDFVSRQGRPQEGACFTCLKEEVASLREQLAKARDLCDHRNPRCDPNAAYDVLNVALELPSPPLDETPKEERPCWCSPPGVNHGPGCPQYKPPPVTPREEVQKCSDWPDCGYCNPALTAPAKAPEAEEDDPTKCVHGEVSCDPCLHSWSERERALRAEVETLKRERDDFKRIGQGFERDSRSFFAQSCKNLERAEAAEREAAEWKAKAAAAERTSEARLEQLTRYHGALGKEVAKAERLEEAVEWRERATKLQAFKDYVHKRLDDAGVPADPESPHRAEGCRIGGRLDWMLSAEVEMAGKVRAALLPTENETEKETT